MTSVYDQKTATYMYMREQYAEGKKEGLQQGIEKGREEGITSTYIKLYKEGLIKAVDAARMLEMPVDKFLNLVK